MDDVRIEEPELDLPDDWLLLCEPDLSEVELQLVQAAMRQPNLSAGAMVEHFERNFAKWLGRRHAVAVASGTLGTWLALRALGIGPGDEVIASPYGWHQVAHAVGLAGARVVFADINYWSGCLDPVRAAAQITPQTRAILVGNVNGHPAAWQEFRALADERTAWRSSRTPPRPSARATGAAGSAASATCRCSISRSPRRCAAARAAWSSPTTTALAAGAALPALAFGRDRRSVSVGSRVPMQASISELTAALGAASWRASTRSWRKRKRVEAMYLAQMQSFEGIKPPYVATDVDEVHWMLYTVHLGKRFTASTCAQIIDDMASEYIEAVLYCQPLHQQFHYIQQGWKRGQFPLVERIADRALALPFHTHLEPDHVEVHREDDEGQLGQRRRRCRDLLNKDLHVSRHARLPPRCADRGPSRRHARALPGPARARAVSRAGAGHPAGSRDVPHRAKTSVPGKIRNRLTAAAQFIENFKHRKTLVKAMNEAFAPMPSPSPLHRWLAALPAPLIVDTWYDDTMRGALAAARSDWAEVQGLSQSEHFGTWVGWYTHPAKSARRRSSHAPCSTSPGAAMRPAGNYLVSDSDFVEVLTEIDIQTPIPADRAAAPRQRSASSSWAAASTTSCRAPLRARS
jgi:perosamine synthetase